MNLKVVCHPHENGFKGTPQVDYSDWLNVKGEPQRPSSRKGVNMVMQL